MDPAALGKALAGRLGEVRAALERHAAFVFAPGEEPPGPALGPGEAEAAAREFVLRALRTAADPVNDRLLRRLAEGQATLAELAALVGLPRLAVWERVNDLVQAGLAVRSLEGDRTGLSPAGQALATLVEEAARAAAGGERP